MSETQEATTGYGGEFWLSSDETEGNLVELVQVTEFDIPEPGARERVRATHLKSPGHRHEYVDGFYEDSTFQVVLNSRPRSDTDALLYGASIGDSDDVRAFKAVIPEDGTPTSQITGTAKCESYSRGRVNAEGVMVATATFRVVTVDAIEAYAA